MARVTPVQKHLFVSENMDLVRRLVKSGDLSGKILADYKMYTTYNSLPGESKMTDYETAGEVCGCGSRTIMNAIKSMESVI